MELLYPSGRVTREMILEGLNFQKELRAKVSGWVVDGYKSVLGLVSALCIYFEDGTNGIRVSERYLYP